jgi:hypothetical protein
VVVVAVQGVAVLMFVGVPVGLVLPRSDLPCRCSDSGP